jgi:hypothetical protein
LVFPVAVVVLYYSGDSAFVGDFKGAYDEVFLKIDVYFVANFEEGFFCTPVDVEVMPTALRVAGDDVLAVEEFVGYAFDVVRHVFEVYSYFPVFVKEYGSVLV